MFKKIKEFLQQLNEEAEAPFKKNELERVTAALMIQLARVDQDFDMDELKTIEKYIAVTFHIPPEELIILMDEAKQDADASTSLYEFTSLLNKKCALGDRYKIVVNLWRIAYADGRVDKYEEHFIRRTANLLYVQHEDFIQAKHDALEK